MGMVAFELFAGIESVELRHANVRDDQIRLEPCDGGEERSAVGYRAHDLAGGFEQFLERFEENGMIVCQEDARRFHGTLPVMARSRPAAVLFWIGFIFRPAR